MLLLCFVAVALNMSMTSEQKLWILSKIEENKSDLLGKFDESHGITKDSQSRLWQSIFAACEAREFAFTCKKNHDGKYLRDQVWGRWKREVLAKRDKCRKTGSRKCPWVAWELKVMDILDEKSPIVEGLGVADSGEPQGEKVLVQNLADEYTYTGRGPDAEAVGSIADEDIAAYESTRTSTTPISRESGAVKRKRQTATDTPSAQSYEKKLAIEKQELVNKKLRLDIFKEELEIYKLCTELELPVP